MAGSLRKFKDYVTERSHFTIEKDPTYKTYDLQFAWNATNTQKAIKYLGISVDEPALAVAELIRQMKDVYDITLYKASAEKWVYEWYVWQRIVDGELRRWPYREGVREK